MKRFGLIISALALVLGLAQCAKKPNMPTFGGVEPSTKTITFTTNGGGDKGDFTQVSEVLNYKWNKYNDVIHVYLEDTKDKVFTGGEYLGEMHIVSMADDYSATFEGTFEAKFPTHGMIRFVHCGSAVQMEGGSTEEDVVFSSQDGKLATISDNVIAVCDKEITEDCTYKFDDCNLTVQFGVVKFTFDVFEGYNSLVLNGISKTGLKVTENGAVEYTDGTSSTLGGITEENKTAYYTVFMPKAATKYTFTDGSEEAYKSAKIDAGVFYTKKDAAGESVELDKYPEGALSGWFSVSPTKTVLFSKGNLYYSGSEWRFEENQYDYRFGNIEGGEYGLFGWSNVNTSFGRHTGMTSLTGDFVDWGTNSIANGGNTPNIWFILDQPEWNYIMNERSDHDKLFGHGKVENQEGMILLPDNWVKPDGVSFTPGNSAWANEYDESGWAIMEDAGAVFLPKAGFRHGIGHDGLEKGFYHSCKYTDSPVWNWDFTFISGEYDTENKYSTRYDGLSVRLVYEIK